MQTEIDEGRIAGLTDFFFDAQDLAREQLQGCKSEEVVYAMLYVLARLEPGEAWEKFIDEALDEVLYQKEESAQMINEIAKKFRRASIRLVV